MSHGASPLAAFHRTGDRSRLPARDSGVLRPALFAPFRDLATLRGDFPLLLDPAADETPWLASLADCTDAALQRTAPAGAAGETRRRQALAVEEALRQLMAQGQGGTLGELWDRAREECERDLPDGWQLENGDGLYTPEERAATLLACDAQTAPTLLRTAWQRAERHRAERLGRRIDRLLQRLADLLRADRSLSAEARKAEALRRSIGGGDRAVIDFEAMASVLRTAPAAEPMPSERRRRIEAAVEILQRRPFTGTGDDEPWGLGFHSCDAALEAWRQALPEMRDLLAGIAVAELELDNRYEAARHDRLFENLGADRLGAADLALFPTCLVELRDPGPDERNRVLTVLESGIPFKFIVQVTDITSPGTDESARGLLGRKGQNLARMALGLDRVFVLQSANSSLHRLQDSLQDGMANPGPALFSVFAGPDYLVSAAAVESRAFPCFAYDPAAMGDIAERYSLAANPRLDTDWPSHPVGSETGGHEPKNDETPFTFGDFLASDPRRMDFFAVPGEDPEAVGENDLLPLADYLERAPAERAFALPYVLLVDDDNRLYRAVVDERVVEASECCRDAWRGLRALAHSRPARAEAGRTDAAPEPAAGPPAQEAAPTAAPTTAAMPAEAAEPAPAEPAAPASDDPWIETIRCTTCNECRQINDRLFGYDADQRAYIADPDAGTYRELVEAAESCQVAIIHPGKPRNPDEPGLEELIERAKPFL